MESESRRRRAARRYELELPFEFRVFERDQSVQEGSGHTLNMSSRGLLVVSDRRIPKGQPIEISVQLPAQSKDATGARLLIIGHVLRSDPEAVAIKILRHGFIRVPHQQVPAAGLTADTTEE